MAHKLIHILIVSTTISDDIYKLIFQCGIAVVMKEKYGIKEVAYLIAMTCFIIKYYLHYYSKIIFFLQKKKKTFVVKLITHVYRRNHCHLRQVKPKCFVFFTNFSSNDIQIATSLLLKEQIQSQNNN